MRCDSLACRNDGQDSGDDDGNNGDIVAESHLKVSGKKIKHNHQGRYKIKVSFDSGQALSYGY